MENSTTIGTDGCSPKNCTGAIRENRALILKWNSIANSVRKNNPRSLRFFLYFGHEIPEFDGAGYDASYADWTFTVHDLAQELKRIKPDSTKFDLIVLSTCFNGTPHSIAALLRWRERSSLLPIIFTFLTLIFVNLFAWISVCTTEI